MENKKPRRPNVKSERLNIRITESEKKKLKSLEGICGWSESEIIRFLINNYKVPSKEL